MTIFDRYGNQYSSLLEAFSIDVYAKNIISVVGGGGKTTIIKTLLYEFEKQVKRAIGMTTTKIRVPDYGTILTEESFELLDTTTGVVTIGKNWGNKKMTSPSIEFQTELYKRYDTICIEADGSKGFPSKAPNDTEPVIPKETTLLLGVQGIDALGCPIEKVCHRPEIVCKRLGKKLTDRLEPKDMARLCLEEKGIKKGYEGKEYIAIIQKVDTKEQLEQAKKIGTCMMEQGFERIFYTSSQWKE